MTHPIKGGRHKHHPSWMRDAQKAEGNAMPPMPQHPGLQDVDAADQQSAMPGPSPSDGMPPDAMGDLDQTAGG